MLLHTTPHVPSTVDPEPTARKRSRALRAGQVDVGPDRGLDVAALNRKYAPATAAAPRERWGSFVVAVPCRTASYEQQRNAAIRTWITYEQKQGWSWTGRKIQVRPARYPYWDIRDQTERPDLMEFQCRTWFRYALPLTPLRLHVPPSYLEPERVGARATMAASSGGDSPKE